MKSSIVNQHTTKKGGESAGWTESESGEPGAAEERPKTMLTWRRRRAAWKKNRENIKK